MPTPTLVDNYARLRKAGLPAAIAGAVAKQAISVRDLDLTQEPDGPRGEAVFTLIRDGLTFKVEVEPDYDLGHPSKEYDCYSADDLAAYDNDQWGFYAVLLTAPNGGTASLGAIDAGDHFTPTSLLTLTEQIMSVAVLYYDLPTEALANGL